MSLPEKMTAQTESPPQTPPIRLSQRSRWSDGLPISFLMQQGVENADVISLAAGLVDAVEDADEAQWSLHVAISEVATRERAAHSRRELALQLGPPG